MRVNIRKIIFGSFKVRSWPVSGFNAKFTTFFSMQFPSLFVRISPNVVIDISYLNKIYYEMPILNLTLIFSVKVNVTEIYIRTQNAHIHIFVSKFIGHETFYSVTFFFF